MNYISTVYCFEYFVQIFADEKESQFLSVPMLLMILGKYEYLFYVPNPEHNLCLDLWNRNKGYELLYGHNNKPQKNVLYAYPKKKLVAVQV